VFGFALEGMPQIVQIIGMGLAFAAIALIAREGGGRTTAFSELRLPLLAGFGFGMYLVLIARASGDSALWPIVAGRFTSITIVGVIGWRLGKLPRPNRAELRLIAASGVFDTLGNTLYGLSAQVGRDAVAAVLSSLYPAATVTWAWVLLKERLRKHQLLGVAFALAAVVLIAL
ncbi:MAG: DMT family transporter, partial [Chloroflexi bacterium]|nr:DMT family transporter [Chloroflexota bacterium]